VTLAEHRMENARRALADHVVLLVDSRRLLPSLDRGLQERVAEYRTALAALRKENESKGVNIPWPPG
jgi:hypothetical protein